MGTLIQITDTHQCAATEARFMGVEPARTLDRVIDALKAGSESIDAIIVSGDIAQQPEPAVYESVAQRLSIFGCPVIYLPGNHDAPELMHDVFGDSAAGLPLVFDWGEYRLLLLDSSVPGFKAGLLGEKSLRWLEEQLCANKPSLIFVHHHPEPVHSAWIDQMNLKDSTKLERVLRKHQNAVALVCGHVHQESERSFALTRQISTPSTCRQFLPGSENFALDNRGPAWRWFRQTEVGLDTGVNWLESEFV